MNNACVSALRPVFATACLVAAGAALTYLDLHLHLPLLLVTLMPAYALVVIDLHVLHLSVVVNTALVAATRVLAMAVWMSTLGASVDAYRKMTLLVGTLSAWAPVLLSPVPANCSRLRTMAPHALVPEFVTTVLLLLSLTTGWLAPAMTDLPDLLCHGVELGRLFAFTWICIWTYGSARGFEVEDSFYLSVLLSYFPAHGASAVDVALLSAHLAYTLHVSRTVALHISPNPMTLAHPPSATTARIRRVTWSMGCIRHWYMAIGALYLFNTSYAASLALSYVLVHSFRLRQDRASET